MSNSSYQETHERILKSGLAAFLEEGFEKANLRRICKAAGVTTGAFYKHFKDKGGALLGAGRAAGEHDSQKLTPRARSEVSLGTTKGSP